ncbi:hypothetical protein N7476_010780 [Penicillium atrosanguineum]|uniref:Serine peptidase, family S28 n=1 Tax=Penicillium atrosanguineum TaxID=1132637 RepID=A0A9W9TZE1_9EURO|nr:hypothetical protein N7476_010780 [Penicillium atrosanguineum]
MHFFEVAAAVAVFSGSVDAIGLTSSARDLTLASRMGINSAELLGQRKTVHEIALERSDSVLNSQYVSIPIDHNDTSVGTYNNRYWVNDEHYQKGGPVFIYDVGESDAESSAHSLLGNSTSFLSGLLSEFGAMGIVWEHRYYGDSLPYPVTVDTPAEHMIYLSNKQALADIPYFAENFTVEGYSDENLTPSSTPWIMTGGSYSGMRSAFTRDQYPDTIFAAWSSSAPVEAKVDMSIYFEQVYAGMVSNGYSNCTKDIKAGLEYIDGELSKNASSAAAIKKLVFGEGAEANNNGDFTAALAGLYGFFQAEGLGGGAGSLENFCHHLETDPVTLQTAGPRGYAPYLGKEYVGKRLASWPAWKELANLNYDTNCGGLDDSQPLSCKLNPKYTDVTDISWLWQVCTEWGYYQSNNFGSHSLLSKYQTLKYNQDLCTRQFPEAVKKGIIPASPEVERMNKETGGWAMRPSNVYWSGGQFDPWRTLSVLATESFAPTGVAFTTEIPKCNVATGEDSVFGYIMQNAEHCFDMRSGFAPGKISRGYFKQALREWLPCFQKR